MHVEIVPISECIGAWYLNLFHVRNSVHHERFLSLISIRTVDLRQDSQDETSQIFGGSIDLQEQERIL